jgi:hypothetical protein
VPELFSRSPLALPALLVKPADSDQREKLCFRTRVRGFGAGIPGINA